MIYAIDFETYYDKQVSITTLGIHQYLHHPDCSIYLVSVYSAEAGFSYVGKPDKLDWHQFHGHTFVAHNARFDRACFERLRELGIVPADVQVEWQCTADLVSALGYGRSLKAAVESVFGVAVNKDTRADMCGKTWEDGSTPILSPKCLKEECAKAGIPAPISLAQDSEDCAAWEEKYGESFPWVAAMRDYRKANTLKKKLETLESRIKEDGSFAYSLKYIGAHTGRWSGDEGFNIQNMPRVPMFGVDLRKMIIPRPGHTFIISDLSQIEQRVLSWLAGDNDMMEELEKGISVYEAHARATMGYSDPEPLKHKNPDLYRLAKARVLGLGYGAGAAVFVRIAKTIAGLDISQQQAQQIVSAFRSSNKHITQLWAKLEQAFAVNMGKSCFALPLPSGRKLYYRNLAMTPKGMSAEVQGKRFSFFGGKLTENLTSATARDVLGEILLNLDAAGYRVVMHIHDEVVVEVPTADVDNALIDIHRIMTTAPEWLEGLPLAAETTTSTFYTK
ncbi:MAG: hypothetical protein IJN29_01880 [Akkermansia sp.]|nr:hypothetical protein [Akkermansia sp.]